MKKVLLTIILTLCIFQMVVLAVDIEMGQTASDRASTAVASQTYICLAATANASGTIRTVEIWANSNLSNCEVATFFYVSGTYYMTTRDNETIGSVTAGSKQSFSVNLDVVTGDYIGITFTSGTIEFDDSGGSGIFIGGGDKIPCTSGYFSLFTGDAISLYGTSVPLEEEEEDNAIFFGTSC